VFIWHGAGVKSSDSIRNQLRAARVRLGWSQQDLAQAAGITRQTIGGIEGGLYSPSASVALRIARALECRVEDLFWLDEDLPPLEASPAAGFPSEGSTRVALAKVGDGWIAHPLSGDDAFRSEMAPADGIAQRKPDSKRVEVRVSEEPEVLARSVAVAGCTPALSLWARAAERANPGLRVNWTFRNSMDALNSLTRGEVHAAGLHLCDPSSGEFNAPYVREALPGRDVALVHLGVWEEGLAVASGNPKGIREVADLAHAKVTIVNREGGAGTRLLLETSLLKAKVPANAIRGWERLADGHQEVARQVASGKADAGVTTGAVAAAYGLDFVPLQWVRYDLAVLAEYLDHPQVRQLLGTLDHRWVRSQFNMLVGYDTRDTGEVTRITPL
jgi:putative molybdopterin biosynthesis protein